MPSTRCPGCQQENPAGALVCGFCKAVLRRAEPRPGPAQAAPVDAAPPPGGPPAAQGLGLPAVVLVAVLSGATGFAARGLLKPPPLPSTPAAAPVCPQLVDARVPPPPVAAPAPPPPAPLVPAPAPEVKAASGPADAGPAAPDQAAAAPAPSPLSATPPPAPTRKRITVPYRAFEGQAQRIILPVTLNGGLTAPMALDTGAPGTILFPRLAERLGVLREGATRLLTAAGGIGGQTAAALVILDSLSVAEARTEFVPATVTPMVSEAFEGLVGMDFVAGYSVQIDTQQHLLVLTELPPSSDRPAGHDEAWWRRTFTELEGHRTQWQRLRERLREQRARSLVITGPESDEQSGLLALAESQSQEAEKLLARLERYASNNGVPREWRRR